MGRGGLSCVPPPSREEIADIFSGIRGLAGLGPHPEVPERSGSRLRFDLWGFWGMLEGGCRGVSAGGGQAQGREGGGWKDGFNQLDLIGMKKKKNNTLPKMERETWPRSAGPRGAPKPAPGSLSASRLPHSRGFGDPGSTKRDCRGIAPFPFPQQSPGKSPNPLENPNPAMRARREPKGLRQRLSSTFWKGKTLWIRFNFPAMTWKGERRGGETYPGLLSPLLCALEKQFGGRAGLVGDPQHPLGTHGIPQDTPAPTVTPPPALGASGNRNSGG